MSEDKKPNMLVISVVIVLAAIGVLGTVAVKVDTLDVSELPEDLIYVVDVLKWILTSIPIALALGFGRNISGYLVNWIRAKRTNNGEDVTYSLTWCVETFTKVEGAILVFTPFIQTLVMALPDDKKGIAMVVTGALFAFIDILLSEIKHVIEQVKKPG